MNSELYFQWILDENFIKKAISKEYISYKTTAWRVFVNGIMKDIIFYFTIYPNGKDDTQKGQFWIEYNLFMRHDVKLQVDLTCYVSTEKEFKRNFNSVVETSGTKSIILAEHEQLLNPSLQFFADGKFILNFEMKANYDGKSEVALHRKNYVCEKLKYDESLDCLINSDIDPQGVLAHKMILKMVSPIFKAMIEAQDDGNEMHLQLLGFEYKVYKNATDFCYGCLGMDKLDLDDLLLLYKFADKYQIEDLKKEVQYEMVPKTLPENICKVANNIVACEDAKWIKKFCVDRIRKYIDEGLKIEDSDTLNDEIKKEVFDELMIPVCKLYYDSSFKDGPIHNMYRLLFGLFLWMVMGGSLWVLYNARK